MNADIKEHLERLKNSPITNEDYYTDISNLCNAIDTISNNAAMLMYCIGEELQTGKINNPDIGSIVQRCYQIGAISRAIEAKTNHKDFTEFQDLIYFYKKSIK